MALRETLQKHPKKTLAVVAVVVAVGIVTEVMSSRPQPLVASNSKVFFTDDDGKNWYPQPGEQIAPCDHQGKTAVRCFVYRAATGTVFAAYEEKLPDDVLEQIKRLPAGQKPNMLQYCDSRVIKRPGETQWVPAGSAKGKDIIGHIEAPDGSMDTEPVIPP